MPSRLGRMSPGPRSELAPRLATLGSSCVLCRKMFDEFVRFQAEATIEKVLEDMGLGWCLKKACDEHKAGVVLPS